MNRSSNDLFYSSPPFQDFFRTSGQSLILKADAPRFTVLAVSDNYLGLTHKTRSEVLNKGLFEVFPGNDAHPSEQFSVFSSFSRVIASKVQDELPVFKYEIYVSGLDRMSTQYWSNLNEPLLDKEGNVAYLINTTTNVTQQVLNHWELEEARNQKDTLVNERAVNEELLVSNESLASDNERLGLEQKMLLDVVGQLTASEARLEQAELALRLATEAAQVGTWYIHCETRELRASNRLKEMFGFNEADEVTLDALFARVTDNYRVQIKESIDEAVVKGGVYDATYTVEGFRDRKIRWLRALGNSQGCNGGENAAFTGVMMDITDQKQADLRKNDFIGMVSHELRAPLTALTLFVQMMMSNAKKGDNSQAIIALDKMNTQVKKMTGMINGFLDKSHLETGKFQLQISSFDIEELINELIGELQLAPINHIVNIGLCGPVRILADRSKIGNVITNLLSNAIKYSPKGKYIGVNCAVVNNNIQVSIKDEGIGLMPQDIEKIFDRHYRVENEDTHKIAGFGIGLYLCAEIIQRHKGIIWAESEIGRGSTFYFSLPVA